MEARRTHLIRLCSGWALFSTSSAASVILLRSSGALTSHHHHAPAGLLVCEPLRMTTPMLTEIGILLRGRPFPAQKPEMRRTMGECRRRRCGWGTLESLHRSATRLGRKWLPTIPCSSTTEDVCSSRSGADHLALPPGPMPMRTTMSTLPTEIECHVATPLTWIPGSNGLHFLRTSYKKRCWGRERHSVGKRLYLCAHVFLRWSSMGRSKRQQAGFGKNIRRRGGCPQLLCERLCCHMSLVVVRV